MYSITIASTKTPDRIDYQFEAETLEPIRTWVRFMLPTLVFDSLKVGTKKEVDGVYLVRFRKEEDLQSVEEDSDLSDNTAVESLELIAMTDDAAILTEMLASENAGKKRKTVLNAIASKLKEV